MSRKKINLNDNNGVDVFTFPDNQPHVRLRNIEEGDVVDVVCSMTTPSRVLQLLQVANAIVCAGAYVGEAFIPYLMGARYDRVMIAGDSFDLQVMAELINLCNFTTVKLLDVHSNVALRFINRAKNIVPDLVTPVFGRNADIVYVCPDKGAIPRIPNDADDVILCEKVRNPMNGQLSLSIINPLLAENRHCVIVDDICDGGRTFIEIGKQLYNPASLTLAVTHGIFSNGFTQLFHYFNRIITTNSLLLDADDMRKYGSKINIINIY